jgi:5-methylcytosine-specific restriction endonuclease McrBC regulatory subunit McrC
MNYLFEEYVAIMLRSHQLKPEYKLIEQSTQHSLVKHDEKGLFQMKAFR